MGEPLTKEKSMSQTTFSGPVASQNGFVTPTYTSTTLPYFIQGNIVYVENLNTLAFGGVDQWYRQDTGVGLGTGGNVGPVTTTYVIGTDYTASSFNSMGTSGSMSVTSPSFKSMLPALTGLTVGQTMVGTGGFGTTTLTINTPFTFDGTNYNGGVTSTVSLAGNTFDTLTF
jgi:hypothetical protein